MASHSEELSAVKVKEEIEDDKYKQLKLKSKGELITSIIALQDEVAQLKAKLAPKPPVPTDTCSIWNVFATPREFFTKLKGGGSEKCIQWPKAPLPNWRVLFFSFAAAFIGIGLIGITHIYWSIPRNEIGWIGSMGAVTVLLTAAPDSPLIQPRNLFGGNIMAAIIGSGMKLLFRGYPELYWFAGGLAVAITISLMQVTKTVHPPAGATAFVAVFGSSNSFYFILVPVLLDVTILFGTCLIIINLSKYMKWPTYWF